MYTYSYFIKVGTHQPPNYVDIQTRLHPTCMRASRVRKPSIFAAGRSRSYTNENFLMTYVGMERYSIVID